MTRRHPNRQVGGNKCENKSGSIAEVLDINKMGTDLGSREKPLTQIAANIRRFHTVSFDEEAQRSRPHPSTMAAPHPGTAFRITQDRPLGKGKNPTVPTQQSPATDALFGNRCPWSRGRITSVSGLRDPMPKYSPAFRLWLPLPLTFEICSTIDKGATRPDASGSLGKQTRATPKSALCVVHAKRALHFYLAVPTSKQANL